MDRGEQDFAITIGKRMRRARRAKDLTQRDAARALEVHLNTIFSTEHGDVSPRLWTIVQLCRLYGISITDVLKGIQEADYVDTNRG